MNVRDRLILANIQSQPDARNIMIDDVGIKGVRYPVTIRSADSTSATIATLSMTVNLPAAAKGTHMSRFFELLEAQPATLSQ